MTCRPNGHQKLVCEIIPTHISIVAQVSENVKRRGEFGCFCQKILKTTYPTSRNSANGVLLYLKVSILPNARKSLGFDEL